MKTILGYGDLEIFLAAFLALADVAFAHPVTNQIVSFTAPWR
jgi:hypothetical protein